MSDPRDHFDHDELGNLITVPLTGVVTVPAMNSFVLARLEYADTSEHLDAMLNGRAPPSAVQLTITPDRAIELGERLIFLAKHILEQQTPKKLDQH